VTANGAPRLARRAVSRDRRFSARAPSGAVRGQDPRLTRVLKPRVVASFQFPVFSFRFSVSGFQFPASGARKPIADLREAGIQ
jgi:hypothetical protein